METDKKKLTDEEILEIKLDIARRWQDPTKRIEDIFNIRNPRGELSKVIVPEPQKEIIRDGILGKARQQIMQGISYITVIDKGRQMGFSVFNAYEAVLIAEDFPDSNIYYVATEIGQARDWMQKMNQLIADANHWPEELGGGPMLNVTDIKKIEVKVINNTYIVGLSANPSAIRGKTGIAVYFDEAAWALRTKDIARETWKALSYIISQGGQGRIQSTPRTSDEQEFFWGIYQKALQKKGGMVAYECPVIENWKDLDLTEPLYIELNDKQREIMQYESFTIKEKQDLINRYKDNPGFEVTDDYIRQPAKVLYPWKNLQELENDREKDYQQFMQEYLCQPIDETLKMIQSEWIETNLVEEPQYSDRGDSNNAFQMTLDFAQKNDVTAIVITEKIVKKDKAIFYQRYVEQTQMEYPEQAKHITDLYEKFRPAYVSLDFTGPGIPISQFLKKEFRDRGFNPTVIKDVTFGSQNKEQMATGFRAMCQPNPSIVEFIEMEEEIEGKFVVKKVPVQKSSYRFLRDKGNKDHINMIAHIKRVEKEVLPQNIRYSGKKYGRDDFFWCYHKDTEVLTKTGWKYIKDVVIGEYIPSLNIKTNKIEYTKVKSTFNKKYNGEMINFVGKSIDLCVTPNHKMVTYKSKGANKYYPIELIEAEKIENKHFKLHRYGGEFNEGKYPKTIHKFKSEDFMLLCGLIISEGCMTHDRKITISQIKSGKAYNNIKQCLESMKIKYTYSQNKEFVIYNKKLKTLFNKYIKGYSYEKRIHRKLLSYHPELLKYLYKGLMAGDGSKTDYVYYTSSPNLASDFQELCFKLGYGTTKRSIDRIGRKALNGITNYLEYYITISKNNGKGSHNTPRFNHHKNIKTSARTYRSNYNDNVVCLELEKNHTLYVRYNGKTCWSGNSTSQICLYETINSQPKAAFGKTSQFSTKFTHSYEKKSTGQQHIFNVNKKRWETKLESKDEQKKQFQKQKSLLERHNYRKSLKFAYNCLRNSKNICQTRKCIVNPIECTNPDDCRNDNCPSYKYVKEISERYHVTIDDLYRLFTKIYK